MRRSVVTAVAGLAALAVTATGCSGKSADGKPEIQVGLISPMSGPFAVLGISQQNSLNVQIEKINATGGIDGAKLKLIVRDSALDPGKAVQAANELAGNDAVKLVIGPSLTAFYDAAKGTYEKNKKLNCQPAVSTGSFAELKYGFRSQDPFLLDAEKVVGWLKQEGVKSLGLVYEADDTGKNTDAALKEMLPKAGIKYLGYQTNRADDQSHRAYVEKFKNAGAIMVSSSAGGSKTMAAAAEIGFKGKLVGGGSGMQNISFVEAAGDAADGAVFPAPLYQYPERIDRAQWKPGYLEHIKAIEAKYGKNVGPKTGATSPKGAAITADCLFAFEQAVKAVKSTDAEKVAPAIEALDLTAEQTPSGNAVKPGKTHEFYNEVHLYQWSKDAKGWFTKEISSS
ncbi:MULTISPECIES: ABC transporter substrate-binding protein [Thermomonosporaceae]|uniref:ABC transporter substrate-binding protein n=1 Tax=Thermomonosporaceae TaxID=2012 RepID=UPI00255A97E0|nr:MULTISPECIES: ABC transporter substrate-binding protein [Thermomonosporaceae]MDL4772531.1 ABC transporter substrate-binding protein [Actinomadura xylanilytica]